MKWTLYPKNKDLQTTLPLSVEIEEWEGNAQVKIEGMGKLELKPSQGKLRADFYFTLPGVYTLEVRDSRSTQSLELNVSEYRYLDFANEFGFFLILFLIVMGGIVLWTRKIMQK